MGKDRAKSMEPAYLLLFFGASGERPPFAVLLLRGELSAGSSLDEWVFGGGVPTDICATLIQSS
jgi:hypothetical protein